MPPKKLVIYTSTDDPTKKLKSATQILLTLTPVADQSKLFESQTPIAWKILPFAPYRDATSTIDVNQSFSFSVVSQSGTDVVTADSGAIVQVRSSVVLEDVAGSIEWTMLNSLDIAGDVIMARNETPVPKTFALCEVDDSMKRFRPLVLFKSVLSSQEVVTSPPVALQAYAVAGYEEGQILGADRRNDFLLKDYKGAPSPIDIREVGKSLTLQLFSDHAGKIKLNQPY